MRRQQQTKAHSHGILAGQQSSGFTLPKYCVKHNIHLPTFYAHRCELNIKSVPIIVKRFRIVKLKVQSVSATPQLTAVYHGVTLNVDRVVEAKWLAAIM
jgi:hypothetical protein